MFDQDYFVQEIGKPAQPVALAIANAIHMRFEKSNDKGDVYYKIRIHSQRDGNGTSHRSQ